MGPRGIAMNTSQHGTAINCILRGSAREQTLPFTSYYHNRFTLQNHIGKHSVYGVWLRSLISCSSVFPLP